MISNLSTATTFLNDHKKPILYGIAGIAAIYVGYRIYKIAFPDGLRIDPTKESPRISRSEAITIAERLHKAMNESGTDEEAIYDSLRGLNHNDFVMVSNAFGKRPYLHWFGTSIFDALGDNLTLVEWFIEELNMKEINKVKSLIPEIF